MANLSIPCAFAVHFCALLILLSVLSQSSDASIVPIVAAESQPKDAGQGMARAEPPPAPGTMDAMVSIFDFMKDSINRFEETKKKKKKDKGSTYVLHVATQPPWRDQLPSTEKLSTLYKNTGGRFPEVRVFNQSGKKIGQKVGRHGDRLKSGALGAVNVAHQGQSVYVLFSTPYYENLAGALHNQRPFDHQICIGWGGSAMASENGNRHSIFTGDVGAACGGYWHWSGLYVTKDHDYQPRCFWIGHHDDGLPTGFQVRWQAFFKESVTNFTSPEDTCNGVDFRLRWDREPRGVRTSPSAQQAMERSDQTPESGIEATEDCFDAGNVTIPVVHKREASQDHDAPESNASTKRTTATVRRPEWTASMVIVDRHIQNSARELCESDMSLGSDYANDEERLFCDMDTKKLYRYCEDVAEGRCFDMEKLKLVMMEKDTLRKRAVGAGYSLLEDRRGPEIEFVVLETEF